MTEHSESTNKRLNAEEFREASELWRQGDHTLDALSGQFGVSKTALHRRFKRNGIKKGEYQHKQDEAIRDERARKAQERAEEYVESFEDLRDFGFKLNNVILRRVAKEISEATKSQSNLSMLKDSMKTLQIAQQIVNKGFESASDIAREIMPQDEEDDLPSLKVEALDKKEIEEIRRVQREEDEELYGAPQGESESILDDVEGLD